MHDIFTLVFLLCIVIGVVQVSRRRQEQGLPPLRFGHYHLGYRDDDNHPVASIETDRLRADMDALKARIAVLERVITDDRGASALSAQIDALREPRER